MRSQKEIKEYIDEAKDRVWVLRKKALFDEAFGNNDVKDNEELKKLQEEICYVCAKYDINFYNNLNEFYGGYWTGVLSALRWLNGEDKDFMEV